MKRLQVFGYELKLLMRPHGGIIDIDGYLMGNFEDTARDKSISQNLEIFEGDITVPFLGLDEGVYKRLTYEVDEVFHCAAATNFESRRAVELMDINVYGTENMLRFARSGKPKRFHYVSTAYVAGRQNSVVFEDELVNEPYFNNEYERTKFLAEKMVVEYAKSTGIPYTIYRPSIIVGDSKTGVTCRYDNLYIFAKVLSNIENGCVRNQGGSMNKFHKRMTVNDRGVPVPIRVPGDPNAFVNLVPLDYVADVITEIMIKRETVDKIFHIVNPNPPTVEKLRDLLISILEIKNIDLTIDGEMDGKLLRTAERLYLRRTRTYYSYLFSKLRFDSNNTTAALRDTDIHCPAINYKLLKILLNYAVSHNWGEREAVFTKKSVPCKQVL